MKRFVQIVRATVRGWAAGPSFQLGAALAFYAVFALAPTLLIVVALAGVFFGEQAAAGRLAKTLEESLGPSVAQAIAETLESIHINRSGGTATFIGVVLVLVAATGMFTQLQYALNTIWGVSARPGNGLFGMIRDRLLAFFMVLGIAALLVLSLAANAAFAIIRRSVPAAASGDSLVWEAVNWLLSLGLLTLLFALIFRFLPDAIVAWRDVWVGAFLTAALFEAGNVLICKYLYYAAPGSVFGPASSLVLVMLWVYYSSQVLLFGAEFTKRFADRRPAGAT